MDCVVDESQTRTDPSPPSTTHDSEPGDITHHPSPAVARRRPRDRRAREHGVARGRGMARETLCDGAPSPAARSLRDRARLRPSVTMRASLEGDAIGSIAHVKRASLREEVERRANVELGVVSDVDEAWRRMSAAPRRGADAARESWLQCERCDRWRRVPRCVETALGEKGTFVCGDGRDGRFNACRRSQEATDREINAMFDDALKANDETRARIRKELINERVKMTQKRKRLDDLRQREARGEIELHEDGTYTKLVKKSKNGKNGAAASSGSAPPHPGPFDEYGWVQCETDGCGKWRKVAYTVSEELASSYRERFVCAMNADKAHASCSAPQELADEEIDDFNRDQGIRKILHQKAVQDHYAHFANGKGPVPNGLVCVSVKLEDKPKPKPKPIIDEAVPSAPIEEGPEDPVDWVPGTPRPYPTPASIGTIPVQVPVTCNSHRGVYLPRRNIFRCYCEQPEHMCANVTGQGDGNMFYGSAWEAHCGRGATRKYKASVRVYLAGPTPQMFIGRWFDHVGLKVVDRGGGGGGGSAKPKKAKSLTKNVIIEVDESFVPGPINQLSLRNLMTVFGFILDGTATGEVKREGDTSEGREKVKEKIKEEKQKTAEELREEVEKELGRLSVVCKSFKIAALTVLKAAGVKKAEKKNADGTALRTQFTVIEEYVDRKDELECQIERSVTLAKNHPYVKGSTTSTANVDDGHPPGWWPSLGVKAERKKLVTEVIEQETYGCDFVTGRDATTTLQKVLPDFSEDDVWALYKHLLSQVNESYGAMTPDTLATQSLALAAEDLAEKFENQGVRMNDMKSIAFSKALWKLASESRVSPEFYAVHRKGFGVVCKEPIKKGEFLIDFLGEIYPPWAWAEKQDAIRLVQKNRGLRDKGPPEFYNMQIERPGGDEEGYSVLFCDAMHENNYAGRLSHTCDPNVEVNLKAINGKYEIHFITNRDIEPGEELAYNYHSCTDNMKEVEAAFCLCGARMCRGSYLNFVGEDNNSQVLNTKHKLIDRQVIAFKAIDRAAEPLNPKQVRCLEQVGFYPGKGLLKCCPSWLLHFVGDLAIYMEEEVNQLPKHILAAAKQEHEKLLLKSPGMEFTYNEKFAKIDALAVRENRTQSIAIMLSKLRRVLTRARDGGAQKSVYECLDKFESAPPPFVRLTDDEVAVQFWGTGTDGFDRSVIRGLLNAMGPHERKRDADEFVKWTSKVEAIADKARKGKMDLRESLLWLRDELIKLPRDKCARHDLAAALVHFYAMTEQFWQPSPAPEHMGYTSDKVAVREDEVNAWGVGAGGGGDKIVARVEKTYRPGYSGATMLQWHKQEVADPTQHLVANRKGNLTMPDIACCYSSRPNQPLARAGSLEHETWIGHLQNWPEETWPNLSGPWGIGNPQKLIGSPIIDAWMQGKRSIPVKVLAWIKANVRPP